MQLRRCRLQRRPLAAQDTFPKDADTARKALDQKRHQLNENAAKELTIRSDVAELDAERERLNSRLIETAHLIQRGEAKMTSIEGRLSELAEQKWFAVRSSSGTARMERRC